MMFKRCSRCRGDLYTEETIEEIELVCLQCGSRKPLANRYPLVNTWSPRRVEAR